jgi:hypothetical protein
MRSFSTLVSEILRKYMSGTLDCILVMNLLGLELSEITRGVSHCGLAIHIKKYLKAKVETQIFHHAKIKSSKRNQNPSRYFNSVTNFKFQHKSKYHLSKILT